MSTGIAAKGLADSTAATDTAGATATHDAAVRAPKIAAKKLVWETKKTNCC